MGETPFKPLCDLGRINLWAEWAVPKASRLKGGKRERRGKGGKKGGEKREGKKEGEKKEGEEIRVREE